MKVETSFSFVIFIRTNEEHFFLRLDFCKLVIDWYDFKIYNHFCYL